MSPRYYDLWLDLFEGNLARNSLRTRNNTEYGTASERMTSAELTGENLAASRETQRQGYQRYRRARRSPPPTSPAEATRLMNGSSTRPLVAPDSQWWSTRIRKHGARGQVKRNDHVISICAYCTYIGTQTFLYISIENTASNDEKIEKRYRSKSTGSY